MKMCREFDFELLVPPEEIPPPLPDSIPRMQINVQVNDLKKWESLPFVVSGHHQPLDNDEGIYTGTYVIKAKNMINDLADPCVVEWDYSSFDRPTSYR